MKNSPYVKACKVIESCETLEQMTAAFRFNKIVGAHYNDNNTTFRILGTLWNEKLKRMRNTPVEKWNYLRNFK